MGRSQNIDPNEEDRIPPGGVRARHAAKQRPVGDQERAGPRSGTLVPRNTALVQAAGVFSITSNRVSLVKPCSSTQRAYHISTEQLIIRSNT